MIKLCLSLQSIYYMVNYNGLNAQVNRYEKHHLNSQLREIIMSNTKRLLTVLFLAIVSTIIAGCGSNTASSSSTTPIISPTPGTLTVTTASPLPAATVGTPYSLDLAASGGTAPYTWALAAGSAALPAGLTLSAGTIAGTPTTAGTVNVNIQVTDAAAGSATKAFSITVNSTAAIGASLYTVNCAACHGALTSPTRQHVGATVAQINAGIASVSGMTKFAPGGSNPLSQVEIAAISLAMQ
jgi:mono/diheme cytochrome c family protein